MLLEHSRPAEAFTRSCHLQGRNQSLASYQKAFVRGVASARRGSQSKLRSVLTVLTAAALFCLMPREGLAMIRGGEGNEAFPDPGWPTGAAAVFNVEQRVAFWEGPPYGGGEYHAECRGDTAALQRVLQDFVKIDAPRKRLVLLDGKGKSFWLSTVNREKGEVNTAIDWSFTVWRQENWERIRNFPVQLKGARQDWKEATAPLVLTVYTGGDIEWRQVQVPDGLEIDDQRLETHGFTATDGSVVEGSLTSCDDPVPLQGRVWVETVEPKKEGGYRHVEKVSTNSDASGKFVIQSVPTGWVRVAAQADGYAPRVVGYLNDEGENRWHGINAVLGKLSSVSGVVSSSEGTPLENAEVFLQSVQCGDGLNYELPDKTETVTDAKGHFQFDVVPQGKVVLSVFKKGWVRRGLGLETAAPASDLALSMDPAAKLRIDVDFSQAKNAQGGGYIVMIEPEGGSRVGAWGGSATADPVGKVVFEDIPAGRYVVRGRPNPGQETQTTEPLTVELAGGDEQVISLKAK